MSAPAGGSPPFGGQPPDMAPREARQQLAQRLPDDVIHDVRRRIEDPAGLAHLGLFLHFGPCPPVRRITLPRNCS